MHHRRYENEDSSEICRKTICYSVCEILHVVLLFAPNSSKILSNFENVFEMPLESGIRKSNNAEFCQTALSPFL